MSKKHIPTVWKWLEENAAAVTIELTAQDLADIAALPRPTESRY